MSISFIASFFFSYFYWPESKTKQLLAINYYNKIEVSMKNKLNVIFTMLGIIFLTGIQMSAQEASSSWNQFRGPDRNGVFSAEELSDFFPEEGPELLWKIKLGPGFSEVTIEGDYVYTMYGEKIDSLMGWEYLLCLEAKSGKEVWNSKLDSLFFDEFGDGPRSTPIIGRDYIYSLSSYGKLRATDKKSGTKKWQIDLPLELGSEVPRWGFSSSPLIVGNSLVVETGGSEKKAFCAFDLTTGKMIWSKGEEKAGYNSPVLATLDGKKQILFANEKILYSFDEKGDTLWTHALSTAYPTAMPVVFEDNKVFISSMSGKGFSIIQFKDGKVEEILTGTSMKNDFSSSLYHEGHFYGFNVAALQCISAQTGEKKWTKRGLGKGSLIMVDDKLLVLSDKGMLIQIKATPDSYIEQGSIQAIDGKSWTAPSYSEGRIYLRNLHEMACYKMK